MELMVLIPKKVGIDNILKRDILDIRPRIEIFTIPACGMRGGMGLYLLNTQAGCNTRSILKCSIAGLNSAFLISKISCLTKAKETSLTYYLPIA